MSLLQLLTTIYALPLPLDMIRVIARFIFMDKYTAYLRRIKREITNSIKDTFYSGASVEEQKIFKKTDGVFLFWIANDERCPQFQGTFCTKCGNYSNCIYIKYEIFKNLNKKIKCKCSLSLTN